TCGSSDISPSRNGRCKETTHGTAATRPLPEIGIRKPPNAMARILPALYGSATLTPFEYVPLLQPLSTAAVHGQRFGFLAPKLPLNPCVSVLAASTGPR